MDDTGDIKDLRIQHQSLQTEIKQLKEKESQYHDELIDLQKRSDIHYALNEILNISLLPNPLTELLDEILVLILDIQWLALNKKGAIFLACNSPNTLDLLVEHNLGEILQKKCSQVPFGTCLCGLAAQTEKLVYRDCVDNDHHYQPDGMKPHGHYCVPIKWRDELVGVLNLYVEHGHESTAIEREFLNAASKSIAGIIERKRLEEKLMKHSYEDELTGLPNRRHFFENLDHSIARVKRSNLPLAVFFIDMDGFKPVNDIFGHDIGDLLLQESATRMNSCLRSSDTLARIGGDEFAVLIEPTEIVNDVDGAASRLTSEMSKPFLIRGNQIQIGISIGISMFPNDGDNAEALLKYADERMYSNKNDKKL